MKTTTKGSNMQRVKLMLLSGRVLTKKYLDRLLDITNSAETVSQLRKSGMSIRTVWKVSKNGRRYGEYVYNAPKKVSRITSQAYRG